MKKLKILVATLAAAVLILTAPQILCAYPITDGPISDKLPAVFINDEPAVLSAPPVLQKETVLVPASDLATLLGLGLTFDTENNALHFFGNTGELQLPIDDDFAYLNGQQRELVCPARLIGETVYAPLLFVAHSTGSQVTWDKNSLSAFVYLPVIESRGSLIVNVKDRDTGTFIREALVAVLETNEISCIHEIGGSQDFLLDITSDFSGIYGLYSLYVTAENYNPAIYRYIPVSGNDKVQITVKLDKCTTTKAAKTVETGNNKKQIENIKNYYQDVYLKAHGQCKTPLIGVRNLPTDDLKMWARDTKTGAGVFRKDTEDYRNYLICMGEKPTGGYHVRISNIACFPDKWIVEVVFSSPALDDMVTQAITYPKQTISMPLDNRPVIFRMYENGRYNYLPIGN